MPLSELVDRIKTFWLDLKSAKKKLSSSKSINVNSHEELDLYNSLASTWFNCYSKLIGSYGVSEDILSKYNEAFKTILRLSSGANRRASFQSSFEIITHSFNEDIVIFLQTEAIEPDLKNEQVLGKEVLTLLSKVPDQSENEYLKEALGCWQSEYLKAATVLLWCAAMDRIHKVIEQNGFSAFNSASANMKHQTVGRFKKFSKEFSVQSLSELRTVFDNDILWVLEGMQLIDSNERTRLASCFEMRCHSGHPGDAPITKYNVLSCFSDIVEIVLANPKFQLLVPSQNLG